MHYVCVCVFISSQIYCVRYKTKKRNKMAALIININIHRNINRSCNSLVLHPRQPSCLYPAEKGGDWRRTPTSIAGALQCHLDTWGVSLVKLNSLTLFWKAETWVGSRVLTQATRGRVGASWHLLPAIKDTCFGCHLTGSVFVIFWTFWSCQWQEQKLLSMKYILFLSLSWVYC